MNDDTFEKLEVWQRSIEMSVCIHRVTASWTDFSSKDQICRAVDSISNNIAEGAEHESQAEFKRFLSYAKASAGETRSQFYLAERLDYVASSQAQVWLAELKEISRMLPGLSRSLGR